MNFLKSKKSSNKGEKTSTSNKKLSYFQRLIKSVKSKNYEEGKAELSPDQSNTSSVSSNQTTGGAVDTTEVADDKNIQLQNTSESESVEIGGENKSSENSSTNKEGSGESVGTQVQTNSNDVNTLSKDSSPSNSDGNQDISKDEATNNEEVSEPPTMEQIKTDADIAVSNLDIDPIVQKAISNKLNTVDVAEEIQRELEEKYQSMGGYRVGFNGYGRGQDQYVCTTFVQEVLRRAGYDVSGDIGTQINIANISGKDDLVDALSKDDERIKGVVTALVSSNQGLEVPVSKDSPARFMKPGDFIQYWAGTAGHAVMVHEVVDDGTIKALGSHRSKHGVTDLELHLTHSYYSKIFCVRPAGSSYFKDLVLLRINLGLPVGKFKTLVDNTNETEAKTDGSISSLQSEQNSKKQNKNVNDIKSSESNEDKLKDNNSENSQNTNISQNQEQQILPVSESEIAKVKEWIKEGITSEIALTDRLFHERHPEIKKITGDNSSMLISEWKMLRDKAVRVVLNEMSDELPSSKTATDKSSSVTTPAEVVEQLSDLGKKQKEGAIDLDGAVSELLKDRDLRLKFAKAVTTLSASIKEEEHSMSLFNYAMKALGKKKLYTAIDLFKESAKIQGNESLLVFEDLIKQAKELKEKSVAGGQKLKDKEEETADKETSPQNDETETQTQTAEPDIHAMSQFIWYNWDLSDMKFDKAKEVIKVVCEDMKLGTFYGFSENQEVSSSIKRKNPNQGYYWYKEDGSPTWSGTYGKNFIHISLGWSLRLNDWSDYLSHNAPGERPKYYKDEGKRVYFSETKKEGFEEVPEKLQNLDVRHIPGGASCFATSRAMLAQAELTPLKDADKFTEFVTGESYEEGSGRLHTTRVSVDRNQSLRALEYIDFETSKGRPVMVGVTYTNRNGNYSFTDHWVVISGRSERGKYTFFDPGTISTKDAGSSSNVFVWDESNSYLINEGRKKYVVSVVRPNAESLKEWQQYEASMKKQGKLPYNM